MQRRNKTIRIFVSSTFDDMQIERKILQEKIFGQLSAYCQKKGWQFEFVDLRWGISPEASIDQQTMKICLDELRRSQEISPQPNFLILIGERYGWCPLPEQIPKQDMENIIQSIATDTEQLLLLQWYKVDTNNRPLAEYVLQPKYAEYLDYGYYYRHVEEKLQNLFERYALTLENEESKIIFERSATEQEIFAGALSSNETRKTAIAYFREVSNIPDDKLQSFTEFHNKDKLNKLNRLKHRIGAGLNISNVIKKEIDYDYFLSENYTKDFEKLIYEKLKERVDEEIRNYNYPIDYQQTYENEITDIFIGREDIINEIFEYIDSSQNNPLVITGDSGCGKSALLTEIKLLLESKKNINIISKYIGLNTDLYSGENILRQIKNELHKLYPQDDDSKIIKFSDIQEVSRIISQIKDNFVLIIDALDQLQPNDILNTQSWLPTELPHNCKVIFATLDGAALDILVKRGSIIKNLSGLTAPEALSMLIKGLDKEKRFVSLSQFQLLKGILKNGNILPLYIRLAISIVKSWHSYDKILQFPESVDDLINNVLDQLALPQHHGNLVNIVLSLMQCSRRGLGESEILDLLAIDDEYINTLKKTTKHELSVIDGKTIIPHILWSRLYYDLKPYLATRIVPGGTVINLFHRKIKENVDIKYSNSDLRNKNYNLLCEYFEKTWMNGNQRAIDEFPFYLKKTKRYNKLLELLLNLDFIQKSVGAKLDDDLIDNYKFLLGYYYKELPPQMINKYACDLSEGKNVLVIKNVLDTPCYDEKKYNEIVKNIIEVRDFVVSEIWRNSANKLPDFVLNKAINYYEDTIVKSIAAKEHSYNKFLINELKPSNKRDCIVQNKLSFNIGENSILSFDGSKVIFIDKDRSNLVIYNVDTQSKITDILPNEKILKYDINPSWEWIIAVSKEKILYIDAIENRLVSSVEYKSWCNKISFVSICGNGKKAIVGCLNRIYIYDVIASKFTIICENLDSPPLFGKITNDATAICYASHNKVVKKNIGDNTQHEAKFESTEIGITSFATTPDGRTTAIAYPAYIGIINWEKGTIKSIPVLQNQGVLIDYLEISHDSKYLLSNLPFLAVWNIEKREKIIQFALNLSDENIVCITPDFDRLLVREGRNEEHLLIGQVEEQTWLWSFKDIYNKKNNYWNFRQNSISESASGDILASFGWANTMDRNTEMTLISKDNYGMNVQTIDILPLLDICYYPYISASKITSDGQKFIVSMGGVTYFIDRGTLNYIRFIESDDIDGMNSKHIRFNNITKDNKCIYAFEGHFIACQIMVEGVLWDIESAEVIRKFNDFEHSWTSTIHESCNGKYLLFENYFEEYIILNLETGEASEPIKTSTRVHFLPCSQFVIYTDSVEKKDILMNLSTYEKRIVNFSDPQLETDGIWNVSPNGLVYFIYNGYQSYAIIDKKKIPIPSAWNTEFTKDSKHFYIGNHLWNLDTFEEIGHYYGDDRFPEKLRPHNQSIDEVGVLTAVKIWDLTEHCYQEPSANCPFCGKRFIPTNDILETIQEYYFTYIVDHIYPISFQLPKEAWNNKRLFTECPHCNKTLRFNPFVYC